MIILFYLFFDLNHGRPAWIIFFLKLYVKTKLGRNFKRNRYLGGCTFFFLFCLGDLAVGKFGPPLTSSAAILAFLHLQPGQELMNSE